MSEFNLEDALDAGSMEPTAEGGNHILPANLYELLVESRPPADRTLEHLAFCPVCVQALRDMAEDLALADTRMVGWDLALPKAASSATKTTSWRLPTEGGRYTIEFDPHSSDPNKGLISLRVSPQCRDELEGRHVTLRDARGRVLLAGKITRGEVAKIITDPDRIEPGFIVRAK